MERTILAAAAVGCLALAGCAGGAGDAGDLQGPLDMGVSHGFPAFVLLVDTPDRGVRSAAAGYADVENRRPARTDDGYHMASITKAFTAVAVLRLVDAGELSLDRSLRELLGETLVGRIPFSDRITVAQLIDHSSGIYGFNNDPEYLHTVIGPRAGEGIEWTPQQLVALAYADRVEPFGEPGTGHFYGDTNYVLLGLIVEQVTGEPFRQHVRRTLLEPLGMASTYFYSSYVAGEVRPPTPRAEGYVALSDELLDFIEIHERFPRISGGLVRTTEAGERIDAAAGLVTTVHDLHRFARALFAGELLSPESQRRMLSVADGIESEPIGTSRLGILRAYHKPYGVVLTAEGDGPGGVNTLMALHRDSGTIVIGFANVFGLFDEVELMLGEIVPRAVEPGRLTPER